MKIQVKLGVKRVHVRRLFSCSHRRVWQLVPGDVVGHCTPLIISASGGDVCDKPCQFVFLHRNFLLKIAIRLGLQLVLLDRSLIYLELPTPYTIRPRFRKHCEVFALPSRIGFGGVDIRDVDYFATSFIQSCLCSSLRMCKSTQFFYVSFGLFLSARVCPVVRTGWSRRCCIINPSAFSLSI